MELRTGSLSSKTSTTGRHWIKLRFIFRDVTEAVDIALVSCGWATERIQEKCSHLQHL
jgi:hypothetical protein